MKRIVILVMIVMSIGLIGWKMFITQEHAPQVHGTVPEIWYCPMHPNYTSDRPGQCPICHMDLLLQKAKPSSPQVSKTPVEDHAQVELNAHQQQLIGIRVHKVVKAPLVKTVRAPAYISTAVELYQLQNDFIDAYTQYARAYRDYKRIRDQRRTSDFHHEMVIKTFELQNKLLALGLSHDQIEKLKKVTWKQIWEKPELVLFKEDQHYWVIAQIAERDLGFVEVGQEVTVHIKAFRESSQGIIRSVGGLIDPTTRSANALIELVGYRGELKANMLASVNINVELNAYLVVPQSAVMDLGEKYIVFVKTGEGQFDPRRVDVAFQSDEVWAVRSGLTEGEEIVTDGNFLLDSESRLRAVRLNAQGAHAHGS